MYHDDNSNDIAPDLADMAGDPAAAGPEADATAIADAAPDAAAPERPSLTASFLAEIARAMRGAAIQERERIAATVADTTVTHEQKVRDRATSEASELRRLADDDVDRIERTAAAELERIRADSERRVGERRGELADHLQRHAALIETEIGRIHGAVDDYGAELDGFFGRLAEEQNPAEIARLAGLLPEPPDLDEVGAIARADAVSHIVDEAAEAEAAEGEGAPAAATAADTEAPATATFAEEAPAADAGVATAPGLGDSPEPSVVGVMDPEAGTPVFDESGEAVDAEPVPAGMIAEDESGEPASSGDAPAAGGISAARLLRSLTPWATSDRPEDDNSD